MTYFIGVAGTHSTGKSTFVDKLKLEIEALGLKVIKIADNATDCRNAGFGILRDHTFKSTLWIMASVIRAEMEASLIADIVLVDRPVPDALGYLEAALEVENRFVTQDEHNYLYVLARMHCRSYAAIFKTTLNPLIPLGSGRDTDLLFRELVDKKITASFHELEIITEPLDESNTDISILKVLNKIKTSSKK